MTDDAELAAEVERLALHGLSLGAWQRFSDEGFRHYEVVRPTSSAPAGLRFHAVSTLAGIALVPTAYLCGPELFSSRTVVLAAAFVAVNPSMIWYPQEARAYTLLAALTASAFWWFSRPREEPSRRNLTWWPSRSGRPSRFRAEVGDAARSVEQTFLRLLDGPPNREPICAPITLPESDSGSHRAGGAFGRQHNHGSQRRKYEGDRPAAR